MNSNKVFLSIMAGGLFLALIFGIIGFTQEDLDLDDPIADGPPPVSEANPEQVVQQSCIGCHGTDLAGGMGPGLLDMDLTQEELVDILVNGIPGTAMPAGTAQGNEEAVAEYLLSLQ